MDRSNASHRLVEWAPLTLWLAACSATAKPLEFNRDVRPILSENCFSCHGQDGNKREAELRLDKREQAIATGAIEPGDLAASAVIERIHANDPDVLMPPPDSNRQLTATQKAILARWIEEGAIYEPHWAFVAPVQSQPPTLLTEKITGWPGNAIDNFVLAKLTETGLAPSPPADRATLIRRLHADLTGLTPTPSEVDEFVADNSPDAYEQLIDRLLASPHYGERMASVWLNAARYADSNGFQQDGDTWQWLWRDWVVDALNADMPFDQFSIDQLAGDLLPNATREQQLATAFNRNHLLNGEGGAIPEEQRFNNLFDRVDTTSTTWLGLTMACAQCHDHKYDPLTQADYYQLLHVFNQVPESGRPGRQSDRIRVAPPLLEVLDESQKQTRNELKAAMQRLQAAARPVINATYAAWKAGLFADGRAADGKGLPSNLTRLLRKPEAKQTDAEKKSIENQLRSHFDKKVKQSVTKNLPELKQYSAAKRAYDRYNSDQIPRVMVMSDARPRETRVLDRGDYLSPLGEPLAFAPPVSLPPLPAGLPANRLGLAKWLFLPEHPLTARVQVNRMWQHFFGTGLVKTVEDMGVQSEYPRHMRLLDWLAVEFRENGWSQKRLHKLLVMSATYRQSSRVTPEQLANDPENRLHGRAARFRLPAMVLRDWTLSASGLLNPAVGGPPVYPYQPDNIWESLAVTKERDFTYPLSSGSDLYRRSLYTFWRRTVAPANMFDAANRQTCTVRISRTCTPLHALTTLNDPTWVESSRVLAEKSTAASDKLAGRLTYAFRRVLGRRPTEADLEELCQMYAHQYELFAPDVPAAEQLLAVGTSPRNTTLDPVEQATLTTVCLAIFNLDEALTRE